MTTTDPVAGKRLRVLAIHRYFWPDAPPYASMLRSITARWAGEGHDVEVLSTQPSYKPQARIPKQAPVERLDGVRVRRISLPKEAGRPLLRVLNLGLFALAIVWFALTRPRFDVIMASTAPPVLIGAAARLAARLRGAKFVYHCMDLHPEIGRISGDFGNERLFRWLRRLDAANCRDAARVVVLSEDMAAAVRERPGAERARLAVINNFDLPMFDPEPVLAPAEFRKEPGVFRVLFAGNVGRFQGLEAFVEAMRHLSGREDVELVFLGEGKALADLKRRAQEADLQRVRFFPHQPASCAKALMAEADLCVVSLVPGVIRYAFPSKTMAYLAEGRPVLVAVERDSELAALVVSEQIGVVVEPGDDRGIATAIAALADDPERRALLSERAAQRGRSLFDEARTLERWSELLRELEQEKQ